MQTVAAILGTIFVFGVIILIHEFGHFVMARQFGVQVIEFAIGMGPKLFSKQGKETLFSIRAVPFGGFCMMLGDEDGDVDEDGNIIEMEEGSEPNPRSLNSKGIIPRMLIFLGGIIFNVLLALVLYAVVVSFTGFHETSIDEVKTGYPMEKAGLESGDTITKVGKTKVNISDDFDLYNALNPAIEDVDIEYERDGKTFSTTVHLEEDEDGNKVYGFTRAWVSGVFARDLEGARNAGFIETGKVTWYKMTYSIKSVFKGLAHLFSGDAGMDDVAGPIGIGVVIGDTVTRSLEISFGTMLLNIFQLMALLSANLAVMNFLPLPGLDGGHLVFLLLEAVRGKPLPPEKQGTFNLIGLGLVLILAVVVAFSDIRQFFS